MGARCMFTTPAPVTGPPGWLSSGSTAHRAPAHHPSRCSPPQPSAASAGCRMTGPDTAGQLRTPAATWRQRRPTSPASPTRWASAGSRSWVILAAARTPWPAPRSCPGVSWPRSACRGLPPFGAEGLDWFAGMTPSGAAEYRAAATGRAALEAYLASAEFDPEVFTPADHAAAFGAWSWMGTVAGQALATDQGGIVDDDLVVRPGGSGGRYVCKLLVRLPDSSA